MDIKRIKYFLYQASLPEQLEKKLLGFDVKLFEQRDLSIFEIPPSYGYTVTCIDTEEEVLNSGYFATIESAIEDVKSLIQKITEEYIEANSAKKLAKTN